MTQQTNDNFNSGVSLNRRQFIQKGGAVAALGGGLCFLAEHSVYASKDKPCCSKDKQETFVGIQIAPHSLYDEGFDYCLDLLRETGGVNTIMVSSLSYYGAMGRPQEVMADHGVPKADNTKRQLPRAWIKHHEKYYSDTTLRHLAPERSSVYSGEEIYEKLSGPAHRRGMKVYERMYEPSGDAVGSIKNLESVLEVDIFGNPGKPCMNNPDYRNWVAGTLRDIFETYDLDGIQYGAERCGPLSDLLFWPKLHIPGCFCQHCQKLGREAGVDVAEAKQGLTEMFRYIVSLREGTANPRDGVMTEFLRILMKYPDILAWESYFAKKLNHLHQLVYDTVKSVKPSAQVGRHVDHQQSSYQMLFRASAEYSQMTAHADFIKLILYHEIAGQRIVGKLKLLHETILKEMSIDMILEAYYRLYKRDPKIEPGIEELEKKGLSPNYVRDEVKRAVEDVSGKTPIYAGIGMDIPVGEGWGDRKFKSNTKNTYLATKLALEAGAGGIVASREYEEITLDSLRSMGKAIREMSSRNV